MTSKSKKQSKAGIYLIKHTPSGTLYVGQADDVSKRWREHQKRLRAGTHHNKALQQLWNESAEKDFQYECCRFDKPISAEQREKKRKIESLRNAIAPDVRRLKELRDQHDKNAMTLWKITSWRRLFYRKPEGFDVQKEKEKVSALDQEIDNVSGIVNRVLDQLRDLEEEHRHLYSRFTKIAGRKLNRLYWYWLGRLPSKPKIRE